MSDVDPRSPKERLQQARQQHKDDSSMLAIIMAGIAALFILGIVVAYNYAGTTMSAANSPTTPSTSTPSTTGSGSTTPAPATPTPRSSPAAPPTPSPPAR